MSATGAIVWPAGVDRAVSASHAKQRMGLRPLTRVAAAVAIACGLFVSALAGASHGGASAGAAPTRVSGESSAVRIHTVQPGETLWALASQAAPEVDPRVTIEHLRAVNPGLVDLRPGMQVRMP